MTVNNPNLDLVNMNAHTKFVEILTICSQDIERKRYYDGQTNGRNDEQPKSSIASLFQKGAIIMQII